ncbi:hypothetical protein [Sinobaca sp. H24]|uniref:hypothetical protein n=1 Tax=Sinobaca sp. H24 TaxID=2923376 RepID=UPI00207A134C|nr:hypothetical protein [Sinobaca sp. H24]
MTYSSVQKNNTRQPLVEQDTVFIEQKIEWLEKKRIKHVSSLCLYDDRIESDQHVYYLEDIFDLSYRWSEEQIGFLYVHTVFGIRTFHIHSSPEKFISTFHTLEHL